VQQWERKYGRIHPGAWMLLARLVRRTDPEHYINLKEDGLTLLDS